MGDSLPSGIIGVLAAVGCALLYFALRRVAPAVSALLLAAGAIVLAIVLLIVVLVLIAAFRKPKGRKLPDGTDVNAVLAGGRADLMELRRMTMRIKDGEIRSRCEEICSRVDRILRTLREKPSGIARVRQFFNYYLPTLGKILETYVRVEAGGTPAAETAKNTMACLGDIKLAMEKMYDNLFADDILDLSVEMEVLAQVCRRDGLISDRGFPIKDEKNEEGNVSAQL